MTDETTTSAEVMAGDVITQPGLYESRGGDVVQITGWRLSGWWESEQNGICTDYGSDGRQRFDEGPEPNRWQLLRWAGPLPTSEVEPETTTEQLAEIEGQAETIQVCEGRWRTRNGEVRNVTPTPPGHDLADDFPWWDGIRSWRNDGRYAVHENAMDLLQYLGAIEEVKTQELPAEYTPPEGWRLLETDEEIDIPGKDQYVIGPNRYIRPIDPKPQPELEPDAETNDKLRAQADELRSEVSHVQNLLGTEKRRVAELEELVTSLRTINDAAEKAIDAAGKENTALERQLAVAKAELTTAAAVCQQLQIELDAAQQVPADSPELRQLRADLARVAHDRDQCKTAYDQIFADLVTIRETTAADSVEAVIEWLQPFRGCNSPALALLLLEALPHIMRSLTGLADEEIE